MPIKRRIYRMREDAPLERVGTAYMHPDGSVTLEFDDTLRSGRPCIVQEALALEDDPSQLPLLD